MNQRQENQDILMEKDAAETVAIGYSTLRKHRYEGTGPKYIRIGRSIRYKRIDIEKWLDEHKTA